jgi:hypothetical protein
MPIELPELDDRTYADLVQEALALIPAHAPEWTNHNASDPGITLIEIFAYLTEMLIYRLNRVSDDSLKTFLRLIDPTWVQTKENLTEEVHDVIAALRRQDRAVSDADFEQLTLRADLGDLGAKFKVARACCFAEPDKGSVRVIVVPRVSDGQTYAAPTPELLKEIRKYLEPRRLLTTRLQLEGPQLRPVGVRLTLALESDAVAETVRDKAIAELTRFLDPVRGGLDGLGWPFGRNVYVSEIYDLLDRLAGVDYVRRTTTADETGRVATDKNKPLDELTTIDEVTVSRDGEQRLIYNASGRLEAVKIEFDELVEATIKIRTTRERADPTAAEEGHRDA